MRRSDYRRLAPLGYPQRDKHSVLTTATYQLGEDRRLEIILLPRAKRVNFEQDRSRDITTGARRARSKQTRDKEHGTRWFVGRFLAGNHKLPSPTSCSPQLRGDIPVLCAPAVL